MIRAVVLALALLLATCAAQTFPLPLVSNALGSHMVLQRNSSARIWGWTQNAGDQVTVVLQSRISWESFAARSSENHAWHVDLGPHNASWNAYTIQVFDSVQKVLLEDVLFGDVYLCGGQSNMQMSVSAAFNASIEIPRANNYPNIRLFTVGQDSTSQTPVAQYLTVEQDWSCASADEIGGDTWEWFSALCWFFARDLYDKHPVPIGLVSNNYEGTYIQTWSSPEVLEKCDANVPPSTPPGNPANYPSFLFNAMLTPSFPMRLKGIIWYQGESNWDNSTLYKCLFPNMITDWRRHLGISDLWFGFVQLSPYTLAINPSNKDLLPMQREAQLSALKLNHVTAITAMDAGDPTSPLRDIHPRNKQILGSRLANAALWALYEGNSFGLGYQGPTLLALRQYSSPWIIEVKFVLGPATSLILKQPTCPPQINPELCAAFEVRGHRENFWRPVPQVSMGTSSYAVLLSVANVSSSWTPAEVRYAFATWPLAVVYDNLGRPAVPFPARPIRTIQ